MGHFAQQMAIYKEDANFYSKAGFTLAVAEKILKIVALRVSDAYYLFVYAKQIPAEGVYLEIGSWVGGSLLCANEGAKTAGISIRIIGIEPGGGELLISTTKSIPNLHLIRKMSDNATHFIDKNSVDLLFIDGDHRYGQVRRDILNYWPKIKLNGILLAHDYLAARGFSGFSAKVSGVKQAIDEIFPRGKLTTFPRNSLLCAIRKEHEI